MTTAHHIEQCSDIRDVVTRVAKLETNEERTHDWVKDLADEFSGLRKDIQAIRITLAMWVGGGIAAGTIISTLIPIILR